VRHPRRHAADRLAALAEPGGGGGPPLLPAAREEPGLPPRAALPLRRPARPAAAPAAAHPVDQRRRVPPARAPDPPLLPQLPRAPRPPRAQRRRPGPGGRLRPARPGVSGLGRGPLPPAAGRRRRAGERDPALSARDARRVKDEPFLAWPGWAHLREAALLSIANALWFLIVYGGADRLTAYRTLRVPVHLSAELRI